MYTTEKILLYFQPETCMYTRHHLIFRMTHFCKFSSGNSDNVSSSTFVICPQYFHCQRRKTFTQQLVVVKKFKKKKIYVHNFQCLIACTEDTTRWYSSYLLVMWGKGILKNLSFVASFKLLVSDTFLKSRQKFFLFVWLNASHWKEFKLFVCCGNLFS